MTAFVFMSQRFRDRQPGGQLAVARKRSRDAKLVDAVDIVDDKGKLIARVMTAQSPRAIGGHAVRGWVEIYQPRKHMVLT
jgi:hypothetical protein